MAFFEFLASIGQLLNSATGLFIKPVGGRGLGGFVPAPTQNPPSVGVQLANTLQQDANGNLQIRGQMVSDEGGFFDDFNGSSLTTALTGTPTFTNGSVTVTGSGTLFTTELSADYYIKRDSDGDSAWAKVARIFSDTSLELDTNYTGTTGGSASSKSYWVRTIGSGGAVTVGTSTVTLGTGTTNGSITRLSRDADVLPLRMTNHILVSQRIANQSLFVGFRDNVATPVVACGIIFDGTTNTTIKLTSQTSSAASDTSTLTVTLPFGATTASTLSYEIDVSADSVTLFIEGLMLGRLPYHTPPPYAILTPVLEVKNTAAAGSNTNMVFDDVRIANYDQQQVDTRGTSEVVSVQLNDEIHYLTGTLTTSATTADQVIVSYTVPTGMMFYIVGYSVSGDGNVDGIPVKIGRNTVTTIPAAPGTVDSVIFRAFFIIRNTAFNRCWEDYSSQPRPIGRSGDVIKMTVTPSGTGSSNWRGTIDFILRAI